MAPVIEIDKARARCRSAELVAPEPASWSESAIKQARLILFPWLMHDPSGKPSQAEPPRTNQCNMVEFPSRSFPAGDMEEGPLRLA